MPDLLEHMYCAQQINIPPNLPFILKQYAKAAIRTQPYDLLFWSAAYFKAKADNLPPPVKERLEYPPFDSPSRLSPGFLRVLHKQLGDKEHVRAEVLYEKWIGVCLVKEALDSMLKLGNIQLRVPWLKFVAIAAGHICSSLGKTMVLICEVLTDQPDGGAAWIPVEKFVNLYQFLASLNCGPNPPLKVKINADEASLTSTQMSSTVAEGEEEPDSKPKVKEIGDQDSTTGLMVWPDVQPEPKADRVRTPKHTDETGASSEFGVEVFDSARGAVTDEMVTLYPATTKSEASQPSDSPSKIGTTHVKTVESVGESILSHSSLQENADWIQIEPKDLYGEAMESQPLDLDKLVPSTTTPKAGISSTVKTATTVTDKDAAEELLVENQDKLLDGDDDQQVTENKTSSQDETQAEDDILEKISEKEGTASKTVDKEKSLEIEGTGNSLKESGQVRFGTTEKKEGKNGPEEKKTKFKSTDSENILDESITMMNFVKSKDVGYSVVEIRKGRFGNQSTDKISEDELDVSPTARRISVESEESLDTQDTEPKLLYWEHVPGIGPVIPEAQVLAVVEYMQYWASKQQGMVGPRNINHLLCPPLDLPPPPSQEDDIIY